MDAKPADFRELASKGKEAYSSGKYEAAINYYSEAIKLAPTVKELFVGRLKAYLKIGRPNEALECAMSCNLLDKSWPASYYYLGVCYKADGQINEAINAFRKGLNLDPNDERMKKELHNLEGVGISSMLGDLFSSDMFDKLRKDPETAELIKDKDLKDKLMKIRDDRSCLIDYMNDHRVAKCMQVLSGVTNDFVAKAQKAQEDQIEMYKKMEEEEKKKEEVVTELEKEVLSIKEEGTTFYKERDFENAIKKYKEARNKITEAAKSDIDDYEKKLEYRLKIDDIKKNTSIAEFIEKVQAYRNLNQLCLNISAVYLAQKNMEKSRKWAEKAIMYSDFTNASEKNKEFISRCYLRIGKCLISLGNDKDAVIELTKGRDIHVTPEIRALIRECKEREVERKRNRHVLNPDNCPALISKGNQELEKKNYYAAIQYYTEALKNDETCMEAYNNRANAYYKNGEYQRAIDDCEGIFKMSLSFADKNPKRKTGQMQIQRNIVRAFIREAKSYLALKKYHYAAQFYFKARLMEPFNSDVASDLEKLDAIVNENRREIIAKRGENMKDKIIVDLLENEEVKKCLQDLMRDPSKVGEYMAKRDMQEKLAILKCAGVI